MSRLARGGVVGYKTNKGFALAVVRNHYASDGTTEQLESVALADNHVVDVVLLGFANGQRDGVTYRAAESDATVNDAYTWD